MTSKTAERTSARTPAYQLFFAGLVLLGACASDPPPPAQPPAPPPAAVEAPPAPAAEAAAESAPVAEQTPPQAEPECQAADDCKKLREASTGLQWVCENAHCLEQAVPEQVQAAESADAAKGDKTSKRAPKGKGSKKK